MKREENYVYPNDNYIKRNLARTWILFACGLIATAPFYYLMVSAPDFLGVFIVAVVLITLADVLFVLLNGLLFSKRYAYSLRDETLRVYKGVFCSKLAIFRRSAVYEIRIKKHRIKGDFYFNLKFYWDSGTAVFRYLPAEKANGILSQFGGLYDERVLSEQA